MCITGKLTATGEVNNRHRYPLEIGERIMDLFFAAIEVNACQWHPLNMAKHAIR